MLIGHWKHDGKRYKSLYLILNTNSTFLISTERSVYTTSSKSNEPLDIIDGGSFCTRDDTLFLMSTRPYSLNRVLIFRFNIKNQSIIFFAPNENQQMALTHLLGEWHKINRFGQRIDLDGVY